MRTQMPGLKKKEGFGDALGDEESASRLWTVISQAKPSLTGNLVDHTLKIIPP
jgi:hypothetical protein